MYDCTSRASFVATQVLLRQALVGGRSVCLVESKDDVHPDERAVGYDEGRRVARQMGCGWFRCSALLGIDVAVAVDEVALEVLRRRKMEGEWGKGVESGGSGGSGGWVSGRSKRRAPSIEVQQLGRGKLEEMNGRRMIGKSSEKDDTIKAKCSFWRRLSRTSVAQSSIFC